MAVRLLRRAAVLTVAMALAACSAGAPSKPAPMPAAEPPQTPPSAEALGPVRIVEPNCAEPPENGAILEGAVMEEGANYYEIINQTDAPAVVKIRIEGEWRLAVAVYVAPGKTARVGPLADGIYRQTQAMGGPLAADCSHLEFPTGYGQFDKSDVFSSSMENGELKGRTQTYELVEEDVTGGQGPQALSAEKFNAP